MYADLRAFAEALEREGQLKRVTVPVSPSSGHSATSVFSRGSSRSSCRRAREIIAARIRRASQEAVSVRCSHSCRWPSIRAGNTR